MYHMFCVFFCVYVCVFCVVFCFVFLVGLFWVVLFSFLLGCFLGVVFFCGGLLSCFSLKAASHPSIRD